jgi:hypothetical protein
MDVGICILWSFGPFSGCLVYFVAFVFASFCGHLVYFSPFWYVQQREIWQPLFGRPRGQFLKEG